MPRKLFKLNVVSVRLVKDAPVYSDIKIMDPQSAAIVIGDLLCEMDREVLAVVNLKSDNTPINCHLASIGSLNQAMAEPRELFKASILSNAASIILVHNHPSGNLEPSKADTRLTDRMIRLTSMLGIPLLDHIIVGGDNSRYFSFKEKQMMANPGILYSSNYEALQFESMMAAEVREVKGKAR
ncbi:JAB domain-containing protein [Anaerobium acetethylicum]|uniref:DNA repair protein RadC n=1 Tax=Anaerobium acetethylicum TaxID=1619234 RepID=A0A1D3TUL7_9FIRM|nr:JAB domain-containing protein [Anaerobium acetethylicum]SCP97745.1 DNA repair protein RadC [Anaerobium acetethylicum]